MSIHSKKKQVLEILYDNLRNPQPQVVNSELIADKLEMSLKDTCHLLKIMDEMGVVVSQMDGHSALITQDGLGYLATSQLGFTALPGEDCNIRSQQDWFSRAGSAHHAH